MMSRGVVSSIFKSVAVTACAGLLSVSAQAAQVTLVGTTINYVYDDSQAAMALFGAPTIVGDVVVFTPSSFSALSENGAGSVTTTSSFVFDRVYHQSGMALASLSVSEQGDYFIDGSGEVSVDLYLQGVTNPGGGTLGSGTAQTYWSENGNTNGAQTLWGPVTGTLDTTTFTQPFGGAPAGDQTDIKVTIQNTLRAETAADGTSDAFIQKKLNFVAVAAVPVPAAVWLFGSALLGLLAVGRRKRAVAG